LSAGEATQVEAAPPRGPHPYRAFAIRIGLGAAIIGFLLWHFDARPAIHSIARERPLFFIAAIAIYVASLMLSAYRWKLLAAMLNLRGPLSEFVRYYFVGVFTNLFVPGLIAGDATRGFYLGRRHHKMGEGIASAIADRAYGLLALFWFAAANSMLLNRGTLPPRVINPTLAIGAVTFAGYLASPLIARMIHLTPRPLRRALGLVAPYLHRPISVLPAIALSVALQASLAIAQYILALGIGLHAPLADFMLIVPIANVFAAMPITFNGLGVRETAYLILFGMAGLPREDAIALGLLWFAATMLGGMTGAIAFVTTPVPSGYREAAGS
jgi:hypothetical protein